MNKETEIKNNIETTSSPSTLIPPVAPASTPKDSEKSEASKVILSDTSINLVPTMSEEEIVVEETKKKLNVSAIVSIIVFLLITVTIVGFNIFTKLQLNAEKEKLTKQEEEIRGMSSVVLSNEEILKRVYLYKDIETNQYSPKTVFDYFNNILVKNGNSSIKTFTFKDDVNIAFDGFSDSLDTISKLWFLLSNDEKVEKVSLETIAKGPDSVRFSFSMKIVKDAFLELK